MLRRRLIVCALFVVAVFAVTAAYAGDYTHKVIPPADPNTITFKELWNLQCNNQTGAELTVYLRGYLIHNGTTVLRGKSGNTLKIPVGVSSVRHDRITSIQESYCAPGYEGFLARGQVPAGVYYACIAAYDAGTNALLDSNCTRFEPVVPGQVRLMSPANESALPVGQVLLFSWTRPMPAPKGVVTYELTVAEVLPTQTAITAIGDNKPVFKKIGISTTNFKYDGSPLQKGKKYAWQVAAFEGGRELSVSEIWLLLPEFCTPNWCNGDFDLNISSDATTQYDNGDGTYQPTDPAVSLRPNPPLCQGNDGMGDIFTSPRNARWVWTRADCDAVQNCQTTAILSYRNHSENVMGEPVRRTLWPMPVKYRCDGYGSGLFMPDVD